MSTGMGENVLVLVKAATAVAFLIGLYAVMTACVDQWFNRRGRRR